MLFDEGNPALRLYELWRDLFMARNSRPTFDDMFTPERMQHLRYRGEYTSYDGSYNKFSWGERALVGLHSFVDEEPIFTMGIRRDMRRFILLPDGRFRLMYAWGGETFIAANTFLGYSWVASRRQWFVDARLAGWYSEGLTMESPYVSESMLGGRWWQLAQGQRGWEIAPTGQQVGEPATQEERERAERMGEYQRVGFERYRALRERRLRLRINRERKANGLAPLNAKPATLRQGNRTHINAEAAKIIAAHLDVIEPARVIPARQERPVEALEGIN